MAFNKKYVFVQGRPFFGVDPFDRVKPVKTWITGANGKPSPNGPQAVDEHGVPMWSLQVRVLVSGFDGAETELAELHWSAKETPKTLPADIFPQTPQAR